MTEDTEVEKRKMTNQMKEEKLKPKAKAAAA